MRPGCDRWCFLRNFEVSMCSLVLGFGINKQTMHFGRPYLCTEADFRVNEQWHAMAKTLAWWFSSTRLNYHWIIHNKYPFKSKTTLCIAGILNISQQHIHINIISKQLSIYDIIYIHGYLLNPLWQLKTDVLLILEQWLSIQFNISI